MIAASAACLVLGGCASRANDIAAAYVSPVGYQTYTCDQLALEAQTVSARAATATGAQNQKAMNDAVAMTVGMVVFWPALFMMKGDGAHAAELSRLKGEMEAIQMAARQKQCPITFEAPPSPQKPAAPAMASRS
jgi:hypothetical protein